MCWWNESCIVYVTLTTASKADQHWHSLLCRHSSDIVPNASDVIKLVCVNTDENQHRVDDHDPQKRLRAQTPKSVAHLPTTTVYRSIYDEKLQLSRMLATTCKTRMSDCIAETVWHVAWLWLRQLSIALIDNFTYKSSPETVWHVARLWLRQLSITLIDNFTYKT